jgi:hypothetical protein
MLRRYACFGLAVAAALPAMMRAGSAPQASPTPTRSLVLITWRANDDQWNFDIGPGTGDWFKHTSRSYLEKAAANRAAFGGGSGWYTLERAKSLMRLYSDSAREVYWLGFPPFQNHYARRVSGYPPADIIEQVRAEAERCHMKLILRRLGE